MLQTMTLTRTLGESDYLESDWVYSSGLAQHQLTKHPENKQQNCESFILGEEGRANGMAPRGEVCHLCHAPSTWQACLEKPEDRLCSLRSPRSGGPSELLSVLLACTLLFALAFLLLFPQQLWPAWRKSVVAFLYTLCLKTEVGGKEYPMLPWEPPISLLRRKR